VGVTHVSSAVSRLTSATRLVPPASVLLKSGTRLAAGFPSHPGFSVVGGPLLAPLSRSPGASPRKHGARPRRQDVWWVLRTPQGPSAGRRCCPLPGGSHGGAVDRRATAANPVHSGYSAILGFMCRTASRMRWVVMRLRCDHGGLHHGRDVASSETVIRGSRS
jgi:hypothetical protein